MVTNRIYQCKHWMNPMTRTAVSHTYRSWLWLVYPCFCCIVSVSIYWLSLIGQNQCVLFCWAEATVIIRFNIYNIYYHQPSLSALTIIYHHYPTSNMATHGYRWLPVATDGYRWFLSMATPPQRSESLRLDEIRKRRCSKSCWTPQRRWEIHGKGETMK